MSKFRQGYNSTAQELGELFNLIRQSREGGNQGNRDVRNIVERLKENAKRYGINIKKVPLSYYGWVDYDYSIGVSDELNSTKELATIIHELGHICCGHMGSRDEWWPNRYRWSCENPDTSEIEAESVAYLVCKRLNLHSGSAKWLGDYLKKKNDEWFLMPSSVKHVHRAAYIIEKMCGEPLESRDSKWLYVDAVLLDGVRTFFIPEHEWQDGHEGYQDVYTSKSLGMQGSIDGYWYAYTDNLSQWESVIETFKISKESEAAILTKESWRNIERITKLYKENDSNCGLNKPKRIADIQMKRFKQRLKTPYLHTCIWGLTPGLVVWDKKGVAEQLPKIDYGKGLEGDWEREETALLYRMARTKTDAEKFLEQLSKNGWTLYSYWNSEEQTILSILNQFK